MTIFACNNLTKTFDRDTLFENISFGLEQGERLGIIGKNGIGKTTLLRIIAQKEEPESGEVVFNKSINFEYLEQQTNFDSNDLLLDTVMLAKPTAYKLIEEHHAKCSLLNAKYDKHLADEVQLLTHQLEELNAWNLEQEAKKFLSKLGVEELHKTVNQLSGGQKKRVALAKVLLSEPDLLILDEPTNHLDADSVQWLQDRLMNTNNSLVFITHDRYFLDAVATRIIEIDQKRLFSFPGNYQAYLEKKEAIIDIHNSAAEHNRSKLRTELAWLAKGAKARRTKQKSRIDWIAKMEETTRKIKDKRIKIELGTSFLGKRVIDCNYISKSIADKLLFKDFTYIAKPGDRIGIIGANGCGKSTLLNSLAGLTTVDAGSLKLGDSVKVGYYKQEIDDLDDNKSLISAVREVAEYIDCGVGRERYLTPRDLLLKFNFPTQQHSSLISTLSGGERRRLALIRMLMANPNIIFLDEPTNDLDIPTLTSLEEYLEDFYGVLLIVSHDRAFLDRTVEFIWAFEENGKVKEYPGNYSFYLEKKEEKESQKRKFSAENKVEKESLKPKQINNKKLSYLDQREFDTLETEIPQLEINKLELEKSIYSGKITDYKLLDDMSKELSLLSESIDNKTMRWLELSEKVQD
jgi:ABC transport system ATP-binding/permease protein